LVASGDRHTIPSDTDIQQAIDANRKKEETNMTTQPFKDEDVLWRWKVPESLKQANPHLADEIVVTKSSTLLSGVCPWAIKTAVTTPSPGGANYALAELLRQLADVLGAGAAGRIHAENDLSVMRGQLAARDKTIAEQAREIERLEYEVQLYVDTAKETVADLQAKLTSRKLTLGQLRSWIVSLVCIGPPLIDSEMAGMIEMIDAELSIDPPAKEGDLKK
jgi:hypothetical protein